MKEVIREKTYSWLAHYIVDNHGTKTDDDGEI
jgi:hypothetical protein